MRLKGRGVARNPVITRFMACLAILALVIPALAQTPAKKPVLIRDTGKAEGKEEAEESKERQYNPLEAERNFKVGDFYFKRKNYKAAIQRYLEAISYAPNMVKAYEALAKAYEKSEMNDEAVEVYKDFLRKYPDSPKASEFESKLRDLEKKSGD